MKKGAKSGPAACAKALEIPEEEHTPEFLYKRMQEAHFGDGGEMKDLDLAMKGTADQIQNDIAK